MNKTTILNKNWSLRYGDKTVSATVPGDITLDLYNAGVIQDPYFGLNHRDLHWIIDSDFTYENSFVVPDSLAESEEILLEFDGIDTFAEVYLNGNLLGKCENMFLQYVYSVKDYIKSGENVLTVKMFSVTKKMDEIDDRGFFGVFNVKRLFIRKAQCHFGWDWAPDMPGYGIWGEVRLKGVGKHRIEDVSYKAYNDGNLSIFTELNYYCNRPQVDTHGNIISEPDEILKEDKLRYTVYASPRGKADESDRKVIELAVAGKKNFVNFRIEDPELWWPKGMGDQPLYDYKVELLRQGEVIDEKSGRFAFRTVALEQKPLDENAMGYKFSVNGKEVFVKGSNWVPVECFTGAVKDEKYKKLIGRAADGNINMLRVWGGGLYEKDVFYDTCDELGIMVWQDLAFACSDIPDDDKEFTANVVKEINYQVKRLRNHPSLIYWCGGNEKTGAFGLVISHGDYFVDVILRGLVTNLDDTRPFARQSPCSYTDVGNDKNSGESHAGCFEAALTAGIENYRELLKNTDVPFISEDAVLGPCSLESLRKMFPEDKLWPLNEYWDDRLMDNPYAAIIMNFAKREKYYADALYGESSGVTAFIAKAMTVHAEGLRAEIEYARANKQRCGGIMNWMYSDIWPSATWAIVDYYGEPKQAYYQMKRSYAPVLLTFTEKKTGTALVIVHDTEKEFSTNVRYGLKTLDGKVVWEKTSPVYVSACGVGEIAVDGEICRKNAYMFAEADIQGEKATCVYSQKMWSDCEFAKDAYDYSVTKTESGLKVKIKARSFVKGFNLRLPDNYKYGYSDNYTDVQAGEEKTIYVYGKADQNLLEAHDFAGDTANE